MPKQHDLPLPFQSTLSVPSSDNSRLAEDGGEKRSCHLFACPYAKHAPWEYEEERSCSESGWTTIRRLRYDPRPLLILGLTIDLEYIFIAAISCLSSARVARRFLSLVRCSHATYMRHHVVTVSLMRRMSPSRASRVFHRKCE